MKGVVWFISASLLVLWSLTAWGAHALLGYAGRTAAANADIIPGSPELIEWASWLAGAGSDFGSWLIIALWVLGALVIVALTAVVNRLLLRRGKAVPG